MAATKRMQNRCKDCGYTWYPKGKNLSRQCPNCGSKNVTYAGGGCVAVIFVIFAIWGVSNFSALPTAFSNSTSTPTIPPAPVTQPIPSVSTPPSASETPATVVPSPTLSPVEEAKREAVRRYPQLGVAGSELNREFLNRYNIHKHSDPGFFNDPSWPLKTGRRIVQIRFFQMKSRGQIKVFGPPA